MKVGLPLVLFFNNDNRFTVSCDDICLFIYMVKDYCSVDCMWWWYIEKVSVLNPILEVHKKKVHEYIIFNLIHVNRIHDSKYMILWFTHAHDQLNTSIQLKLPGYNRHIESISFALAIHRYHKLWWCSSFKLNIDDLWIILIRELRFTVWQYTYRYIYRVMGDRNALWNKRIAFARDCYLSYALIVYSLYFWSWV